MHLAATQFGELFKSLAAVLIVLRKHRDGHKHFISVKTWVVTTQIFNLGLLDGFNHTLRDELDIVINAFRVWEQAEEYGHSPRREFAFLVAHSMLHLCGYDHMTPEEARRMEVRQEAVLLELGIPRE